MIKFKASNALVYQVSPVIEIASTKPGGQPFHKREVIIDDTWVKDDSVYPNYVCIEFTGNNMQQLDAIQSGMRVNVEGMIIGREYNGKLFHTIRGLKISPYVPPQHQAPQFTTASQQPPQQSPQGYAPQQGYQPQQPQQPMQGYQPQQAQPQPQQQGGWYQNPPMQSTGGYAGPQQPDDLPF